jgi:hypothetical protein
MLHKFCLSWCLKFSWCCLAFFFHYTSTRPMKDDGENNFFLRFLYSFCIFISVPPFCLIAFPFFLFECHVAIPLLLPSSLSFVLKQFPHSHSSLYLAFCTFISCPPFYFIPFPSILFVCPILRLHILGMAEYSLHFHWAWWVLAVVYVLIFQLPFFTTTKQIVHPRYLAFYSGSLFLEVASRIIGSLCRPAVESVLIFSHQSFYSNRLSTCLCAHLFYFVLTAVFFIS